jgi:hypothetical protein
MRFTVRRMMALLVVLALPMLVMSFIVQAREGGRDTGCKGQLFQYGLALNNYQEAHGHLPPAFLSDNAGTPAHSWRVAYLPDWPDHELSGRYDLSVPWNHPRNAALLAFDTPAHFFWCPSGDGRATKFTDYVAVVGPETAWPGGVGLRAEEITDDQAGTILVLEVERSGIHWMEPRDPSLDEVLASGLGSSHGSHVNALFADFRVRRIRTGITRATLRALLTVSGGERIDPRDWEFP